MSNKSTAPEDVVIGPGCRRLRGGSLDGGREPLLIRAYRPSTPVLGHLYRDEGRPARPPVHAATPAAVREAFEANQRAAVHAAGGKQGGWEGYCVVLWHDRRAGLVGLKDRDGELVREMATVSRLQLSTGVPAKGFGWVDVTAYCPDWERWLDHAGPEPALAEWLRQTLPELHPHVEELGPISDV